MTTPAVLVTLAVCGAAALVFGAFLWRAAVDVVTDARRTLKDMFGDSMSGLFDAEPDPRLARIAAVVLFALGASLFGAAVIVVIVT